MNEQQEMAGVAEALGTWKAAGKAVIAIQRALSDGGAPTEEEREYFDLLVGLFEHASRGVEKVERRVSLSSDSARDYSAFLDVAGAVLASTKGAEEEGGEIGGLVRRLRGAAESFSRGETPSGDEARLLSRVLWAIAEFNARQASDFLLAPQPSI